MKVVTYLGFTVLSIFIQFCVMDFIQEKIQKDGNSSQISSSYQKKLLDDILKNISSKPHALYYRTHMSRSLKRISTTQNRFSELIHINTSLTTPSVTTDMTTTILDILYEENTSPTEGTSTTEQSFLTTDYDNVTEITFFDTENKSTSIPNKIPKTTFSKHCACNLLYKVCDINCCCDPDCTNYKQEKCEKEHVETSYDDGCIAYLTGGDLQYGRSMFDSLFCVVKTNLPDKRNIKEPNLEAVSPYIKWKIIPQEKNTYEFSKKPYSHSDPIWLLKNGTIYYLDFPTPMVNNYCTDRAPMKFLKDKKIQCMVKLNDLEMFHVSKTAEESMVISAVESTLNSSTLNCSNLHCINWTILACDNGICTKYNKSLNEASCTDSICVNLALKIDYFFYYSEFKFINATIKLHIQNISNMLPFMMQEISVKFILSNESIDNVIEFSGNPGYVSHLPVIISNSKSNFTDSFFNNTLKNNFMFYPENQDGMCVSSNLSQNAVKFGLNKRMKCRYTHRILSQNDTVTNTCKMIQGNISELLRLNKEIWISPFGNPYGIDDDKWIKLQTEIIDPVHGQSSDNLLKLHCYNIVNRVSIVFMFGSVDEQDFTNQNKILKVTHEIAPINISFNVDDISTVLTIDINFVDITKPNLYVYAGSPHLNIHLPKDFFFPFPPNSCSHESLHFSCTMFCCVLLFIANKITFE